jgi:diacylglycerol O-acyltransferase
MPHAHDSGRLSWGDALFLYLEREGMPLNIASVSVFEGVISLEACRQFIESKLPLIPRYRQRVVSPPFNLGLPAWEYDPKFDIQNHIREVTLKHGTDSEFKAAAGKILSTTLDRQRPLWDLILVRGLKGNRTGLILRVHHCLADGVAGVGIMNVIMDASPVAPVLPTKKPRFRKPPQKDAWTSIFDGWISWYASMVQKVLMAQSEILNLAEKFVAGGEPWPVIEFARLLPELASPTERLFFNQTYRGPQKFAWAEIPMADVKAIRETCGGTHNDVVLTLVTSAIRRYAELHGDPVRRRMLRIMVPVNVRGGNRPGDLGNRISLLPVTIPLDIRNPRKLLSAVRERMEFLKRAHVAELVGLAGGLVGTTPTLLQAFAGPMASQLPITPFNLVCTNIPGPQSPLYLLGHKMLQWYPYVPVGGDMAVNCAVLSYNGNTYFGIAGDVHAAPDLNRLEKFLRLSLEELRNAAQGKAPRKQRSRPQAKVARASAPTPALAISTSATTARPPAEPAPAKRPPTQEDRIPLAVAAD